MTTADAPVIHSRADVVSPPPAGEALPHVLGSAVRMVGLLGRSRLHHPRDRLGVVLAFADGSSARVYRETRVGDGLAADPAVLVVGFVLRGVHGRAHAVFRLESWLITPLFVGFPGFTSKLWMADDQHGLYRGVYEWDRADRAWEYVRALSWVLGLVSVRGSIRAHVVPGVHRDDALVSPELLGPSAGTADQWWRPVSGAR